MGHVRHGSATTTQAVRATIQRSQASLAQLSRELGINPKTVAKWRKRETVEDMKTGPKEPHSTVLSEAEEAMIVAFRRHSLLPLDDCLYALQPTIPHLTRSSLHRCLQRHGISRLPDMAGDKPTRRAFKAFPIGFFRIDSAEIRTAEGKLHLFVAIDRTGKFAFVQLVEKATRVTASAFLVALIKAVPYRIHTVLTDNGIQFCFPRRYANGPTASFITHMFDMRCQEHGIEHRLTKPNHPWTNGQVERMNRTIKEDEAEQPIHWIGPPNGKRYHYDDHDQLRRHLMLFIDAYNQARRLKTLHGLTPAQFIWKQWQENPGLFYQKPCHLIAGPYT